MLNTTRSSGLSVHVGESGVTGLGEAVCACLKKEWCGEDMVPGGKLNYSASL